jgi:hypothetical protein
MKRFVFCSVFGIALWGMSCFDGTQGYGQTSGEPPSVVCNAVELFVAEIDATRAIREKTRREEKYKEALAELALILKRHDMAKSIDLASRYIDFTEQVLEKDPADPAFSDLVGKRLKSRTDLMNPCAPFTTQR